MSHKPLIFSVISNCYLALIFSIKTSRSTFGSIGQLLKNWGAQSYGFQLYFRWSILKRCILHETHLYENLVLCPPVSCAAYYLLVQEAPEL